MKRLLAGLIPFVLIALVAVSVARYPRWPGDYSDLLPYAVNLFAGLGILLAWRFHRSRYGFVLLAVLAGFDLLWLRPATGAAVLPGLALLLPVVLAGLILLPERSLLSLRAWPQYTLLLGAAAALWVMVRHPVPGLTALLQTDWVPPRYTDWTGLPQSALLLVAVLLMGLVGRWLVRPGLHHAALAGCLISAVLMLDAWPDPALMSRWAGLVVVLVWLGVLNETYRMAYMDELTELPARRALREQFQGLTPPYTLAMLDVDHFKRFNDRYGHDVGDNVLRLIAARLREVSPGRGFRYGGEEFTLVFPGCGRKEVEEVLEEFRHTVASKAFNVRRTDRRRRQRGRSANASRRVQVTVSIGVADSSGPAKGPWAVLKLADKALYRAKRKGRNQLSY